MESGVEIWIVFLLRMEVWELTRRDMSLLVMIILDDEDFIEPIQNTFHPSQNLVSDLMSRLNPNIFMIGTIWKDLDSSPCSDQNSPHGILEEPCISRSTI